MKKPSSKIRDEIAKLQEQLKLAETREAERIGRVAQSDDTTDHDGLKPWLKRELAAFLGRDADRVLFRDLLWQEETTNGDDAADARGRVGDSQNANNHPKPDDALRIERDLVMTGTRFP
ncbi:MULTISPECIES: TraC family protein [Rhizobium]|jgi:TraC-like protein|uniref:TraC family protein n=1 Tax=Rhizobium TaxID=379 RepID=UPI000ADF8FD0|nr:MULTISPECIES: TraC family protein [Rhizobium]